MAVERRLHLGTAELIVMTGDPASAAVAAAEGSIALQRDAGGGELLWEKRGPLDTDWYQPAAGGGGGGGGAPTNAQYITAAPDATLTAERVLTAVAGQTAIDNATAGQSKVSIQPHLDAADPHAQYTLETDPRLTDARTPTAHKLTHQDGGTDEISVAGLSGLLADAQTPLAHTHAEADITGLIADLAAKVATTVFNNHHARHEDLGADEMSVAGLSGVLADPQPPIIGSTGTTAVAGNDARLTNARTPTAHATTHQPGGTDAMAVDAVAGTGSLRTLGTGAQQAAAGNDTRLSDARTPTAHGINSASGFHTASGMTAGWVLRATGATTFAMAALQAGDIPNIAESQVTNLTTDLAAKAPTARLISTTAPLTGGGDLSADRTLAISDATTAAKGAVQLATSAQTTAGLAVQASDTRLSDARTPTAHKTSHQSGGSDEINVGGLLGVLANPQPPIIGSTSTTAIAGNDSRVLNAEQTTNKNAASGYAGLGTDSRVPAAQSRSPGLTISANVALAASTTVNITGLDLAVKNGDTWILDYFIPVTVSGGTVGLKPIFTGVTSTLAGSMDCQGNTSAVTASTYARSTTPTTALGTAFITALFTGYIWVRARIVVSGADGTIRFGLATGTSAAGNILAGASLMATKV